MYTYLLFANNINNLPIKYLYKLLFTDRYKKIHKNAVKIIINTIKFLFVFFINR